MGDASTSGASALERELMAMTEAFTVEDASEPLSFASWNANGLLNRIRDKSDPNGRRTRALLALSENVMRKRPDVIALQEVWLKCEEMGKGTGKWDHAKMGAEDKKLRDEKAFIEALMGRRPFKNYDAYYCLANARRAGVITMVKKCLAKPIRVARTLALDGRDVTPDEIDTNEGRVLMLEYEKMIVLNTYVPHNGSNAERYEKRALWDFRVQRFLENYRGKKDVVWMGDLNVAHQDHDVGPSPRLFEGVGGFTLPERRRFTDILAATDMVDTYRAFNGDRLTYTWRSTRGQGLDGWQGMRLDYFVVPRKLVARIKSCETSTDRFDDTTAQSMPMSCFMDSDHCMIHLSLHKREDDDDEGENEDEDEEENARRAKQQKLDRDADVILISD